MSQRNWRKLTQRRRRENWGKNCQFCGTRWMKAKTNYLQPHLKTCLFCHQRLVNHVARGAAWMLERSDILAVWQSRLESVKPKRRRKAA